MQPKAKQQRVSYESRDTKIAVWKKWGAEQKRDNNSGKGTRARLETAAEKSFFRSQVSK